MPFILCRVIWAIEYKNKKEWFYYGNMKYPKEHNEAHETLNFADEKGFVYGFVEHNRKRINLTTLGAGASAKALSGVTVIWCALAPDTRRLRVVGWYDNATAYREAQSPEKGSLRGDWVFQFKTKATDAHLIPIADRFLEVPMKSSIGDKGFIGQSNWFFPERSDRYGKFLEAFNLLRRSGPIAPRKTDADRSGFEEGQRQISEIKLTVRNPNLVRAAKSHYGCRCQVCDFSFEERYGRIGRDFVEVHHLVSFAANPNPRSSTVDDVRVVCSNCHRMIHKRTPPYSVEELQKLLK